MQAVSTAQVCQDRLVEGIANYLSSVPKQAGDTSAAPVVKPSAPTTPKEGKKTVSATSLQGLVARAKERKAAANQK